MCIAALAAVVTVFDVFFGIVPSASPRAHGNGNKQACDDGAHEQATQGFWTQDQAHQDGHNHGQQRGDHHFFDGRCGEHVDCTTVVGLGRAFHDAFDLPELPAHLFDHSTGRTTDGLHGHGSKEVRNHAANEEANDHQGV